MWKVRLYTLNHKLQFKCVDKELYLMESLVTNVTLVCLFSRVSQSVVLVVSFLMKSFPTKLTNIRFVAIVYSHVCVQCGAPEYHLNLSLNIHIAHFLTY